MDNILSKSFNWLRFPLAVMVVFLHIDAMPSICVLDFDWLQNVECSIYYSVVIGTMVLSGLAVPTFFFMSGYLLFCKPVSCGIDGYKQTIKKKMVSLILPYVVWNAFAIGYLWITESKTSFTFYEMWVSPANFPLWFLRDLIVLFFFYPLIRLLICKGRQVGMVILVCFYLSGLVGSIYFFQFVSIMFFSLGGFLGNLKWIPQIQNRNQIIKILVAFGLIFIATFLTFGSPIYPFVSRLYLLLGVFVLLYGCYYAMANFHWKVFPLLGSASFMVYVFHKLGPTFLAKYPFTLLGEQTYFLRTAKFILATWLAVGICVLFYYILKTYCPLLLFMLTGRKKS